MPFDWGDFVQLAEELCTYPFHEGLKEAVSRCVVSRAYYGAFGTACGYAETYLGFPRSNTSEDHTALRDFLKKQPESRIKQLGTKLDRLRQWRNQCDYDSEISNLNTMVQNALASAKAIVNQIRQAHKGGY